MSKICLVGFTEIIQFSRQAFIFAPFHRKLLQPFEGGNNTVGQCDSETNRCTKDMNIVWRGLIKFSLSKYNFCAVLHYIINSGYVSVQCNAICTKINNFEGETSVRLRTHEGPNGRAMGAFRKSFEEKWPRDVGNALEAETKCAHFFLNKCIYFLEINIWNLLKISLKFRDKNFIFWFEFHWGLFLRFRLTISQHWFR